MVSLKIKDTIGKVGFVADIGFGKRAKKFSYNDAGSMAIIKQLYLINKINDKVKLAAGSWATQNGRCCSK